MENIYLKSKEKSTCNGCTACSLICPRNCIEMKEDSEGFIYPVIDDTRCISCGKCLKTCSNGTEKNSYNQEAYGIINKNKDILIKSSSGGAFYNIAKSIIEAGGIVYGVAYNENLETCHMKANTIQDLYKFMGSKYVRSNILGIYEEIKEELLQDKKVLFVGTPCQVQGLKTYLNKDYDNLITCDLICYANPSPLVFKKYIEALENSYNDKVIDIKFRSKDNGWDNAVPQVVFEGKNTIEEDSYHMAFARALINRPCCSSCKFTSSQRVGDITIGDLWGVNKISTINEYKDGVSLFIINSKKGANIFDEIKREYLIEKVNLDDAFKYNHNSSMGAHRNRKKFFKKLNSNSSYNVIELMNKYSKERLARRIINKIKGR